MKFLDAKRGRAPSENKMAPGPSADKSEPSTSEKAPAVSGSPTEKEPDATPNAARLAEESGIELASIKGTGAGGRITVDDVRAAMDARNNQSSESTDVDDEEES